MSTAYEQPEKVSEVVVREPFDSTRTKWVNRVRSADHKVVGQTFIGLSIVALALAGFCELLTLAQLSFTDGTVLSPERFYALLTISNTTYLYLFALPLFAGLATYVLPLQIGARTSAFPRLSALGSWLAVWGGALLFFSPVINVWQGTLQVSSPLSTYFYSPAAGVDLWLVAAILIAGGLTFNAIDLAVTFKVLRAEGMTAQNTPVFAYASAVYAYGVLVTAPVLVAAALMALVERQWGVFGIFNPVAGGNALLWKTLFQWFSHSAPYLVTIGAIGATSEILAAASGRGLANSAGVKKAIRLFAILGILSFGQVYFGGPVAPAWNFIFMLIGVALVIPATVIVASWIKTVASGDFRPTVPSEYAIVFAVIFTIGIVLHVAFSMPALSQWLAGSAVGTLNWSVFTLGSGLIGGMSALLYWFPKITGRAFDAPKARLGMALTTAGFVVIALSTFSLGVDGFGRDLAYYTSSAFQGRNIAILVGFVISLFGVIGLIINFIQSNANGAKAGNDPWHAGTLEWFAPSPPPVNNFDAIPAVDSETPLLDVRERIAAGSGELAGSVAQSPTSGRPSLRESKH